MQSDQLDEYLKENNKPQYFHDAFGGLLADLKVCTGCPHRFEREQKFTAISVAVRGNRSLEEALAQDVRGDLLDGDNAYFCEICKKKVSAVKRTCLKALPPTLVVHLKRFDFDWDRNVAVKFNDNFTFPMELDMKPYTIAGVGRTERVTGLSHSEEDTSDSVVEECTDAGLTGGTRYALAGVVVHMGLTNAGHYYSYVRIRSTPQTEADGTAGLWYRFNDTSVCRASCGSGGIAMVYILFCC